MAEVKELKAAALALEDFDTAKKVKEVQDAVVALLGNHGGNAHAQRQDALLEQLVRQQREGPSAARIDPGLVLR